jgi:aminoglycoside 3-N-acetyltransferase
VAEKCHLVAHPVGKCTAFHLAEYRARNPRQITECSPVLENGQRVWKAYQDIELDPIPFKDIGCEFESVFPEAVKTELVGDAISKLFPMRPAIDFAVTWIEKWYETRQ